MKQLIRFFVRANLSVKVSLVALIVFAITIPLALIAANQQQQLQQHAASASWTLQATPPTITPTTDCFLTTLNTYHCLITLAIFSGNATPNKISWTSLMSGPLSHSKITPANGILHLGSPKQIAIDIAQSDCQTVPVSTPPTENFLFSSIKTDNNTPNSNAVVSFSCHSGPISGAHLTLTKAMFNPGDCGFSLDTGLYVCTTAIWSTPTIGNQSINWTSSSAGLPGMTVRPLNGTASNMPQQLSITVPKNSCKGVTGSPSVGTITFTNTTNPTDKAVATFDCTVTPSLTPSPTCTPRPACVDAIPACQLAVPLGGWCPKISPTPQPVSGLTCGQCSAAYSSASLCLSKTEKRSFCWNNALGAPIPANTVCVTCTSPRNVVTTQSAQ